MFFAVSFCAGAAFGLLPLSAPVFGFVAGLLFLGVLVLLPRRKQELRLILILLGAGLGLLWSWVYGMENLPEDLSGQELVITGTALSYSQESSYGVRVEAKISALGETSRAYVYLSSVESLKPGDSFTVTASLEDCFSEGNAYGYSEGFWLYAYGADDAQITPCDEVPLRYLPKVIAHRLEESLSQCIPEETLGYATALTIGDRSLLSDSEKANLKSAGVYHMLALSGMHLSVLVGMLSLLVRRKKHLALLGIPVCILFCLITGCTPSIVRAAVMECLLLGSYLVRREPDTPTSLSLAALLLTLQNPWCLLNWGLQLSFFSVIGLYLFLSRLQGFFSGEVKGPKLSRRLRQLSVASLSSTISATAFTLPLQALYFGMVSLVSPLGTLLLGGIISLLFGLSLITAVLGIFAPSLGLILGKGADLGFRCIMLVAKLLSRIPFGVMYTENLYSLGFLILLFILLLLLLLRSDIRKWIPIACLGSAFSLCVLLTLLENTGFRFTVLDVGQGQCLVFQSGSQTVLVDCGGNSGNAGDTAADFLYAQGLSHIDLLILTHYDSDHTNGVTELLGRVTVDALLLPEGDPDEDIISAANAQGIDLYTIQDTLDISLSACSMQVFPPVLQDQDNESCLSLVCQAEDLSILVTGDMDQYAEAALLMAQDIPDIDILVAGHHGSKTSTSQALLNVALPEIAVISVGANSYGHPAQETLDRLSSMGAEVYRTDQNGTITFKGA
jgi:competence protein ComEC